jgi:hypothetical protein
MRSAAAAVADEPNSSRELRQRQQAQLDRLIEDYNTCTAHSSYAGQALFDGSVASLLRLGRIENVDLLDCEQARQAADKLQATAEELDKARLAVSAKMEEAFSTTVRALEVSAQEAAPADSACEEDDDIGSQTSYVQQLIISRPGLAELAQGNLVPESVFKLMQA